MTLRDQLAARLHGTVVVVGVGNPLRGDDAAGCLVAQRLRGAGVARVIEAEEVPEAFVGDIAAAAPDVVVVVDAVDLVSGPGAVAVLGADDVAAYAHTTHRLPLSLVMSVVRSRTGADALLIAVQPAQVAFGTPPSLEVAASVEAVAGMLAELLGSPGCSPVDTLARDAVAEGAQ